MMVIQRISPHSRCDRQIQIPPIRIHITFMIVVRQPVLCCFCTMVFPKGQMATETSLSVCTPKGIPIMEINNSRLAIRYSKDIASPPNSSQSRLPSVFIEEIFCKYIESVAIYFYTFENFKFIICQFRISPTTSSRRFGYIDLVI